MTCGLSERGALTVMETDGDPHWPLAICRVKLKVPPESGPEGCVRQEREDWAQGHYEHAACAVPQVE